MANGGVNSGRAKRSMTGTTSTGLGKSGRGGRGGAATDAPPQLSGGSHVPTGNTALSVKADEARLNTITDEKERKRLKRLLRNRISAQQARERKKVYLAGLEQTESQKQNRMAELENRVTALERENQMLRQVIQTVTRRAVPADASAFSMPAM